MHNTQTDKFHPYTVHCTLYTVHSSLYTVNCTVYSVQCTLWLLTSLWPSMTMTPRRRGSRQRSRKKRRQAVLSSKSAWRRSGAGETTGGAGAGWVGELEIAKVRWKASLGAREAREEGAGEVKRAGNEKDDKNQEEQAEQGKQGRQIEEEVTWYSMLTGRSSRRRKLHKITAFTKKQLVFEQIYVICLIGFPTSVVLYL